MATTYQYRIASTIHAVDAKAWDALCTSVDADITLTNRYLRVVEEERLFDGEPRYITLSSPDAPDLLAAAVCTIMPLDVAGLAGEDVQRAVRAIRRHIPAFLHLRAVFCGTPLTLGHSAVLIRPGVDEQQALRMLDRLIRGIARQARASIVLYQDFSPHEASRMEWLEARGYLRIQSLPVHLFPPGFHDFEDFTDHVRASYRRSIRVTQRKLRDTGVRLERVEDPAALIALYGEPEHQLYRAVEAKAEFHFEIMTRGFFHALARACPGEVTCTVARAPSGQVIGFLWSLLTAGRFHTLYVGLDYVWNARCDLYFNLFFSELDYALRRGATHIDLGQTAGIFKTRLGARQESRYLCFQALHPFLALALRWALPWLAPSVEQAPVFHIFHDQVTETAPPDALLRDE